MWRALASLPNWTWRRLQPWFVHRQLGLRLVVLALLLSASALTLDLYLDDLVGAFTYSDREGAARLFRNHSAGFGFALGDPVENHWLMEEGWAPWWLHEHMRFAGYRPLSVLSHRLDFGPLRDHPWLMHAHSLLWLALMVLAVTRFYRELFAPALAGAAATLFALDSTHGFEVGYIMNRHALIGLTLGALTLAAHVRSRRTGHGWGAALGWALYIVGLLSSELSVTVAGYVVAFELCDREDSFGKRLLSAAPYVAITLVWLALYKAAGCGAEGTDYYIDPGREPLMFVRAFTERAPLLLLGQLAGPPSELYYLLPPDLRAGMLGWAFVVIAAVGWMLLPVLRHDRTARFLCVGMLGGLLPAAGPDANNRQLLFVSLGAIGLFAQSLRYYAERASAQRGVDVRSITAALMVVMRLVVSPLLLPLTTASIGLAGPVNTAAAAFASEPYSGKDVVFVTAPYIYQVRVVQLFMRMSDKPLPRRVRYISAGPRKTTFKRTAANTAEVEFEAGLFSSSELRPERHPHLRMPAGTTVQLEGCQIEVLADLPEAGPTRARFTFDKSLDDPALVLYRWQERRFVPFTPPRVGEAVVLQGSLEAVGFE